MKNIRTFDDLLEKAKSCNKKLYEVIQESEAVNSDISVEKVRELMQNNLIAMKDSVKKGINSSELSITGLSGQDSKKILSRYKNSKNLPLNPLFGNILSYSISVMEENLRMGKIVACPTAGSCGIVPSVIVAYSEELVLSAHKQVDALITAAGIGKIVSNKMALAGAVAGCQAECGVAGAMAAGALVELQNGSNEQILNAAALALKNSLGLACDPVAGLVEIPCIKRNAFLATQAVTASELSLAGVTSAIPIDEVVDAMKQIGLLMSPLLKESSEGGLATTPTGLKIAAEL